MLLFLFGLAVLHVPGHTLFVLALAMLFWIWIADGMVVLAICDVVRVLILSWWGVGRSE